MEPAATELEQVLGKDVSAGNIVDSCEIKVAPEGVRNKVSIDKDDQDARFAQQGRQSAVDLVLSGTEDDNESADGTKSAHTYSKSCMNPKSMCSCWWQWKSVRPGLFATKSNSTS
jgi:hypothetical protein